MSVSQAIERQRNQELVDTAREEGVDVGVFMLLDQQPSGFIRKGTENMPNSPMLTNPVARAILRESAYRKDNPKGGFTRVPTEYVFGAQYIEKSKLGDTPRNPVTDRIEFRQGMKVVVGEGANLNLLEYMRKDSRNETCDCSLPNVEKVYKEIFPEKVKEGVNEDEFYFGDALKFIRETFITGKDKKGYIYDDVRLRAFCNLFGIAAETAAGRVQALISTAKLNPQAFIKQSELFEQKIYLDISHGEQMGIIRFDATNVSYVEKDRILTTYSAQFTADAKRKALASFFMSAEGREEYNIFLTELEFKSQQSLNSN